MQTPICALLGIDHPIVGFTPSEHVAAAISRAGGLGVLGCVRFNDPAELDAVLDWMDDNTGGRPYGVDVVMPARVPAEGAVRDLEELIPPAHRDFVERTLLELGVPPLPDGAPGGEGVIGWLHSVARKHVEVALSHPARLIANALGPPPPDVIAGAHQRGMLVAALAGKAQHARDQVAGGVDIVVAQGYEAGGHTGEIGSMVLIPEIVDAVGDRVPVLAAGGIGCGRQIAAALALGAAGVWMGSAWLLTQEYAQTTSAPPSSRRCWRPPRPTPSARGSTAGSPPGCCEPLDGRLGAARRPRAAADAAAERARRPGAPAADAGRGAGRGADAGRADRRPDHRDPAGRRRDRDAGAGDRRGAGPAAVRTAVVSGYWGAGPPPGAADLFDAAERLGFDQVWTAEAYGSDAWTPLAWWGSRTTRVQLGTSVSQLSARPPTTLAMTAMTMDHLTGGRVLLGIGTSNPQVVEGWYGQPYPRPLERTREYIDILRLVIARAEPVSYDGRHYQLPLPTGTGLGKPLRSILHPYRTEIPIYLGAEGPKNVALAAEIADGWNVIFFSPAMNDFYAAALAEGFARPGARHTRRHLRRGRRPARDRPR